MRACVRACVLAIEYIIVNSCLSSISNVKCQMPNVEHRTFLKSKEIHMTHLNPSQVYVCFSFLSLPFLDGYLFAGGLRGFLGFLRYLREWEGGSYVDLLFDLGRGWGSWTVQVVMYYSGVWG